MTVAETPVADALTDRLAVSSRMQKYRWTASEFANRRSTRRLPGSRPTGLACAIAACHRCVQYRRGLSPINARKVPILVGLLPLSMDAYGPGLTPVPEVTRGHHNLSHHGLDPDKIAELRLIEEGSCRRFATCSTNCMAPASKAKRCSIALWCYSAATWETPAAMTRTICRCSWPVVGSNTVSIWPSIAAPTIRCQIYSCRSCSDWELKPIASHQAPAP